MLIRTFCLSLALLLLALPARSAPPARRWVWVMTNLQVNEEVPRVQGILRRAAAAGYNGLVISDYKMNFLGRQGEGYFRNLETVRKTAADLKIELYPTVCPMGYSNGLLSHDPDLTEGIPVKDAPFVVKGQEANLAPASTPLLKNGDFEEVSGDTMAGYAFQDHPGTGSFADRETVHGGKQSLRMEGIAKANPEYGNCRVMQTVAVRPFRQYHLSVWVKTRDFDTPANARCTILDPSGRSLAYPGTDIKRTQDWTQYHIVFNSLENDKLNVYLGVWGGKGGAIWWDEARLEEVGLLNVVRRSGCPLTVTGEDGAVYEEGRDFEKVTDPRMGTVPWPGSYGVFHEPPSLKLTPDSRIRDGQRLKATFYHSVVINGDQVVACLSDPEVYRLMEDQVRRVEAALHPKGYLLGHDEIRVANWCADCRKRGLTPGEILADNVKRCAAIVRKASPKAEVYAWSDMFDPYHNAMKDYYLVNGSLLGSWVGLDKGIGILNWNHGGRMKSVPWFSKRGHKQVLAGYYDDDPESIRGWLDDHKDVPNVTGVMYTTWGSLYDGLEAFAKAAWGDGERRGDTEKRGGEARK